MQWAAVQLPAIEQWDEMNPYRYVACQKTTYPRFRWFPGWLTGSFADSLVPSFSKVWVVTGILRSDCLFAIAAGWSLHFDGQ